MVAREVAAWQQADGYVASVWRVDCRMREAARTIAPRDSSGSAHWRGPGQLIPFRCTLTDFAQPQTTLIGSGSHSVDIRSSTGVRGYIAETRGHSGRGSYDGGTHGISFATGIHAIGDSAEEHGGHATRHAGIEDVRCNIKRRTASATTAVEGTFVGGGRARLPAGGPARASLDRNQLVVDFVQPPTSRYRLRVFIYASVRVPVYVELVSGSGNVIYYSS